MSGTCSTFLLQPHLFTKETLIQFLEQKCMNLKHLNTMSKEQLVDLYQHIVLPLPQRKYRQNRQGKLLTELQNKDSCERKSVDSSCTSVTYGFNDKSPGKHTVNSGIGDRLKPPPDAVNFERRKIRLNSNSKSNDLDHIKIKKRRIDSDNGYVNRSEQDTDRIHDSNSSRSREEHSSRDHKVVLKRSKSASMKQSDSPGQEPSKKKDKKPITWP